MKMMNESNEREREREGEINQLVTKIEYLVFFLNQDQKMMVASWFTQLHLNLPVTVINESHSMKVS